MRPFLGSLIVLLFAVQVRAQSSDATCGSAPPLSDPASGSHWNGWGAGPANTRFQPASQARLSAADVPKLKLKWAFGIENVTQARSQPEIAGGRLYMASDSGMVYALDPRT